MLSKPPHVCFLHFLDRPVYRTTNPTAGSLCSTHSICGKLEVTTNCVISKPNLSHTRVNFVILQRLYTVYVQVVTSDVSKYRSARAPVQEWILPQGIGAL